MNRYFKVFRGLGFSVHVVETHYTKYDPATKPFVDKEYDAMRKVSGSEIYCLKPGVSLSDRSLSKSKDKKTLISPGAIELISDKNDTEKTTNIYWWLDTRDDIKTSYVSDKLNCPGYDTMLNVNDLTTPFQLMATNYIENRGYTKGGTPFLTLTHPKTKVTSMYDKESSSKNGNKNKINGDTIRELKSHLTIAESNSERASASGRDKTPIWTTFIRNLKGLFRGKSSGTTHAVAKYSGDTGQVLSSFLPKLIPNSLVGNITHDRLFWARCLLNGVEVAIIHHKRRFTIAIRGDVERSETATLLKYQSKLEKK